MVVNNKFFVHRIDLFAPIKPCPMLWIVVRPFDFSSQCILRIWYPMPWYNLFLCNRPLNYISNCIIYRNPSLGLMTKIRVCKGAGQEWAWESQFMFSGVQESMKEWTPTFPSELSLWELESQWTLKSLEGDCKGQNELNWKVFYIIGNFLERRCLKWACMTHLGF